MAIGEKPFPQAICYDFQHAGTTLAVLCRRLIQVEHTKVIKYSISIREPNGLDAASELRHHPAKHSGETGRSQVLQVCFTTEVTPRKLYDSRNLVLSVLCDPTVRPS